MFCTKCGNEVTEEEIFCTKCGFKLNKSENNQKTEIQIRKDISYQFCRNCGNRIDETTQFCPKCGAKVFNLTQDIRQEHSKRKTKNKKSIDDGLEFLPFFVVVFILGLITIYCFARYIIIIKDAERTAKEVLELGRICLYIIPLICFTGFSSIALCLWWVLGGLKRRLDHNTNLIVTILLLCSFLFSAVGSIATIYPHDFDKIAFGEAVEQFNDAYKTSIRADRSMYVDGAMGREEYEASKEKYKATRDERLIGFGHNLLSDYEM